MAASDALPVPRKNAPYRFSFAIRNPTNSNLITGWTGQDSEVSKDAGAYADCTNEATEIGTSGTGYIDLTASEMNADCVILKITVTNSGAVPLVFVLYPEEAGDVRVNVTNWNGSNALKDTDNYPAVSVVNYYESTLDSWLKVDAIKSSIQTVVTKLAGITSLGDWIRRIVRKDAGTAGMTTAQTEINTGGTATFAGTTDSMESLSDAVPKYGDTQQWNNGTDTLNVTATKV